MKIGIISDTHDNEINTLTALTHLTKIGCEVLLHAGDLVHASTLEYIAKHFNGTIYCVGGNADILTHEIEEVAKKYRIYFSPTHLSITLDDISFLIVHKDLDAKLLAVQHKPDVVVYGHTHKPWKENIGTTILLNPGNICDTRFPATCAMYDTSIKQPQLFQLQALRSKE